MRICLLGLGYDNGRSGISKYIKKSVQKLQDDHYLVFICDSQTKHHFENVVSSNVKVYNLGFLATFPIFSVLFSLFLTRLIALYEGCDLIFCPALNRRVIFPGQIPSVGTIHDISQFSVKNKYDVLRMFYVKRFIPYFVKRFTKLLTVSNNTKLDVIKFWSISDSCIEVSYLGFDFSSLESADVKPFESRQNFIYVSRLEHPGKNHINLLRAYSLLPISIRKDHKLYFVGEKWNGADYIFKEIDRLRLQTDVVVTGFVSDRELSNLYSQSKLSIYPSFYEGFGIPILEAMAYKTPVICSSTSSLQEVGGSGVITFDPKSPLDISKTILSILNNNELTKNLILRADRRLKQFCWEKHFEKITL